MYYNPRNIVIYTIFISTNCLLFCIPHFVCPLCSVPLSTALGTDVTLCRKHFKAFLSHSVQPSQSTVQYAVQWLADCAVWMHWGHGSRWKKNSRSWTEWISISEVLFQFKLALSFYVGHFFASTWICSKPLPLCPLHWYTRKLGQGILHFCLSVQIIP